MNQNWIEIELDTTAPLAEVFAPNITATDTNTYYRIEANEHLSNIQEFYFIDANKTKHEVTLSFHGTYFEGTISFNNFAKGMANFYITVFDDVLNKSATIVHTIQVIENREYRLVIGIQPRTLITTVKNRGKLMTSHLPYVVNVSVAPTFKIETRLLSKDGMGGN